MYYMYNTVCSHISEIRMEAISEVKNTTKEW
jgi:hypothetical protein